MKSIHLRAALALAILLGALVLFVRTRPASNPETPRQPLGNFGPETQSLAPNHKLSRSGPTGPRQQFAGV